jgi:hypothetical protein
MAEGAFAFGRLPGAAQVFEKVTEQLYAEAIETGVAD